MFLAVSLFNDEWDELGEFATVKAAETKLHEHFAKQYIDIVRGPDEPDTPTHGNSIRFYRRGTEIEAGCICTPAIQ